MGPLAVPVPPCEITAAGHDKGVPVVTCAVRLGSPNCMLDLVGTLQEHHMYNHLCSSCPNILYAVDEISIAPWVQEGTLAYSVKGLFFLV